MRLIDMSVLRTAAEEIRDVLRTRNAVEIRAYVSLMRDYHGFDKVGLSDSLINVPSLRDVPPDKVQVELVRVNRDLSDKIHHHDNSDAYVIGLGPQEHLVEARYGIVYKVNYWTPFRTGDRVAIPKGMSHGFSLRNHVGILYFLSIQSPPISGEDHDDFHLDA